MSRSGMTTVLAILGIGLLVFAVVSLSGDDRLIAGFFGLVFVLASLVLAVDVYQNEDDGSR